YGVTVLDLYLYGEVFAPLAHPALREVRGDIRNRSEVRRAFAEATDVIHLACISNDPSFELDPELGRSINYACFPMLIEEAKAAGVRRFIYASSSSVYGLRDEENVTEDLPLRPLTDYSKYKAMCEEELYERQEPGFTTLTVRPATVCGYAPRLRLDLTVNILTNHAVTNRAIRVFGGEQMRPNIHIDDMVDFYLHSLTWPEEKIDGRVYNAGYHNRRVREIAESVRSIVGEDVSIRVEPTDDNRSYHISSEKIKHELGFEARRSIENAVDDLLAAFENGKVPDSMNDDRYYNIRTMQKVRLS
ncbi:MAG: SDR family oxidoreductase, partial [Candidatus Eremiobacteraeota bacterium]|nr:SDR family oxidoreductase [Candidatus Eremiobacteraeota bacterium]